jgi:prolyl 4-hydroxylase
MPKKSISLKENDSRHDQRSEESSSHSESSNVQIDAKRRESLNDKKEIVYVKQNDSNSQYLVTFFLVIIAVLFGMVIQNYLNDLKQAGKDLNSHEASLNQPQIQIDAIQKEISKMLSEEFSKMYAEKSGKSEATQSGVKNSEKSLENSKTIKEDKIINEQVKVGSKTVNSEKQTDGSNPDIKISNGEPIVLDSANIKFKPESEESKVKQKREKEMAESSEDDLRKKKEELARFRKEKEMKKRKSLEKEPIPEDVKKPVEKKSEEQMKQQNSKLNEESKLEIPAEIKNFPTKIISQMKPKKMWIPIPNSNGGHRRVPAIEVTPGKDHRSSVKVWLYEEFLSEEECKQLIEAHESHLKAMLQQKPIVCFDSVDTLKKNLQDLNRHSVAEQVSSSDFVEGTMCMNQTFSRQLEKWGLKWSFSTAFYPGESKFSKIFGKRIEDATMLNETHGGKFQITSYPFDVGYKDHTDCVIDSNEQRDRYATFLVYLNDLGADKGGETIFSELGIDVKPRKGRALTWNNMNYDTGKCEPKSKHEAAKVKHPVEKKYIIQRWYYYKNFYSLGKRTQEPSLPQRSPNTPKVSCDYYDQGSCRMYDEWNMDHLIEYKRNEKLY